MSNSPKDFVVNFGQLEVFPNLVKSAERYTRVLDTIGDALNMEDGETIIYMDINDLLRMNAEDRWYSQYDELIETYGKDLRPADCTRSRSDITHEQSAGWYFIYLQRLSEKINPAINDIETATPALSVLEEQIRENIDAEYEAEFGVKPPPYDTRICGEVKIVTAEKLWEAWIAKHIKDEHSGVKEDCTWSGN